MIGFLSNFIGSLCLNLDGFDKFGKWVLLVSIFYAYPFEFLVLFLIFGFWFSLLHLVMDR